MKRAIEKNNCKNAAHFEILRIIRESVKNNHMPFVLTQGLKSENYSVFFSALLIIEELHLEEELMPHETKQLMLKRKRAAQGVIHHVEADENDREFDECYKSESFYDVPFIPSSMSMKRMYEAIEFAGDLERDFLFPVMSAKRLINSIPFVPFDSNLNLEQKRSVGMILGCNGSPPYAIFGPPGTGKTSTLVEAILQVYKMKKDSRILVCSASNSATDHILDKLVNCVGAGVKKDTILRLNSKTRSYQDVRSDLIPFCSVKCPKLKGLSKYKIVISTYVNSSVIFKKKIKPGKDHFTHIFLDEAGQASEPECMVPISRLCQKETVVVLAGDPKQLGTVIHSENAVKFGLGKSYLERLFEFDHYKNGDECYVTKLVRNYRCHPKILDLPSKLFYNGELLASKKDSSHSVAAKLHFFPNKQFPILFYGVQGYNEKAWNNPSWYNQSEASKVVEIINLLRQMTDLNEADIGVISPYSQQVLMIGNILETQGIRQVKVGSVEQFQGQEREVIIISTVRSTMKNKFERIQSVGFLSNPRRFNVAITRAKSLLIVVGNPHVVCQEPYWDEFLRYCTSNNSYVGCPLPNGVSSSSVNP